MVSEAMQLVLCFRSVKSPKFVQINIVQKEENRLCYYDYDYRLVVIIFIVVTWNHSVLLAKILAPPSPKPLPEPIFDPLNLPYLLRRDSLLLFSFLDWLIDVDECSNTGLNDCSQLCENTNGSYQCSCANGFSLQPDNTTCAGKKKHQTSSESQTLFAFNFF